jgi:hypothetical protein
MRVKNQNLEMIWYIFWVNLTEGLCELKLTVSLLFLSLSIYIYFTICLYCDTNWVIIKPTVIFNLIDKITLIT